MSVEKTLMSRSASKCELCGSEEGLTVYQVQPVGSGDAAECVLTCPTCYEQIQNPDAMDANHWRCLNDSMWSTEPAVQVMAWRLLNRLKADWTQDLLDMLYLDDETLAWAKADGDGLSDDEVDKYIDSNGAELKAGDTVTIIKDLNVKGTGFTAKRGTAVRNIILSHNDPEHIEGKVNGQHIYILTKYVKKN
ncbi:PhnA domain-containing protein [Carboxylicivirga marina]|uniref:PhnA domain-containing protein n=1 Tax=Carboxylicivirga marina TaxID=2800988 RepID=A0ABS1HEQ1_9BACT|nr:alkylphosphonate utilization protein [Carboxylicivirga marina]MBK3515788.1 PhnA domain-containing protein [Carboxylicivirga marina]